MEHGANSVWPGDGEEDEHGYSGFTQASAISAPSGSGSSSWQGGFDAAALANTTPSDFIPYSSNYTPARGSSVQAGVEDFDAGVFTPAPQFANSTGFTDNLNGSNLFPPMFLPNNVNVSAPCAHPNRSRSAREVWSPEEDNLLLKRRKEGRGFAQIAQEIFSELGITRSENCLAKRLGRIQEQYLEVRGSISFSIIKMSRKREREAPTEVIRKEKRKRKR